MNDYILIEEIRAQKLAIEVRERMKTGYMPLGRPFIVTEIDGNGHRRNWFMQAMTHN